MKKSIFILFLSILLSLLSILISCGGSAGEKTNDGGEPAEPANIEGIPESETDKSDKNEKIIYTDDLEEFDFGGHEYTMLTRNTTWYRGLWNVEHETGDVLDDAIYRRNRRVEDRFNFTFKEIPGSGDASVVERNARNSILAGDNEYDLITLALSSALETFIPQGYIHPVNRLPHVNLDKPYWDKKISDDIKVANKLYLAIAAYNTPLYDYVHILLFNKPMIQELALENPYELVKSNKWTFDKFEEMGKAALKDVNGDGKYDKDDIYGYLSRSEQVLPSFWIAANVKSVGQDKDGVPHLTIDDRFYDVYGKILEITRDSNIWNQHANDVEKVAGAFENNQGLFAGNTFFYVNALRAMETDFGIIPYPKWDESQDKYYSRIEGGVATMVPVSADDKMLERTSVILEAMACESLNNVIPAYYDVALKTKHARDEESAEMIDIIFSNRVFDFGDAIWYDDVRNGVFNQMFQNNNRNLASKVESMENKIKKRSDELVAAFEELP